MYKCSKDHEFSVTLLVKIPNWKISPGLDFSVLVRSLVRPSGLPPCFVAQLTFLEFFPFSKWLGIRNSDVNWPMGRARRELWACYGARKSLTFACPVYGLSSLPQFAPSQLKVVRVWIAVRPPNLENDGDDDDDDCDEGSFSMEHTSHSKTK